MCGVAPSRRCTGLLSGTRVYVVPVLLLHLATHKAGVERLLASYRSIPATASVRLAKPTSNLFRARTKRDAPGLDTSGLTQRHQCRSRSPHRRRGRHVHLRRPGGRDSAVWPFAAGGSAAEDHHPRRRGHRLGYRVGVVSQRSATRIGAGDGYPHRRWRIAHRIAAASTPTCSAPSPIRMGRWGIQPGYGSSWSPSRRLWRCGTSDSTRCPR